MEVVEAVIVGSGISRTVSSVLDLSISSTSIGKAVTQRLTWKVTVVVTVKFVTSAGDFLGTSGSELMTSEGDERDLLGGGGGGVFLAGELGVELELEAGGEEANVENEGLDDVREGGGRAGGLRGAIREAVGLMAMGDIQKS